MVEYIRDQILIHAAHVRAGFVGESIARSIGQPLRTSGRHATEAHSVVHSRGARVRAAHGVRTFVPRVMIMIAIMVPVVLALAFV